MKDIETTWGVEFSRDPRQGGVPKYPVTLYP